MDDIAFQAAKGYCKVCITMGAGKQHMYDALYSDQAPAKLHEFVLIGPSEVASRLKRQGICG